MSESIKYLWPSTKLKDDTVLLGSWEQACLDRQAKNDIATPNLAGLADTTNKFRQGQDRQKWGNTHHCRGMNWQNDSSLVADVQSNKRQGHKRIYLIQRHLCLAPLAPSLTLFSLLLSMLSQVAPTSVL